MPIRNRLILAGCLALLVIGGTVFALRDSASAPLTPEPILKQEAGTTTEESSASRPPALVHAPEPQVALTKSAGEPTATLVAGGVRYALTAPEGATLKDAMDRLATEGSFTYKYRDFSGLGAFVTEVNGRASTGEDVWILHVNGKKSGTGISSTHIRSNDLIEWKLEKSY
ncbi:MAG: hypothetical protein QOE22_519 [Candidatus Parcubacteria bacterium]|jgi:hypothetical protein|nr:hypothetical protein [Candidatus Parcubacteria bacterium]